jgi:hypothetical protein
VLLDPNSGYQANGLLDEDEPGIGGVEISLGMGTCPSFGLAKAISTADGLYLFSGLKPGTYCVTIDPGVGVNSDVLQEGRWTYPIEENGANMARVTLTLSEDEIKSDVYFAWDYRDLPVIHVTPSSSPTSQTTDTPEVAPLVTPTATASPSQIPVSTGIPTSTLSPNDPKAGLGNPAWFDSLTDGDNWPLYEDDHVRFEIENENLIMTAFNPDNWNGWMLTWPVISDFYLEAEVMVGACSGLDAYGLVYRASRIEIGHQGYLFGISCDGQYSLRIWDGQALSNVIDWTMSSLLSSGADQTHRIGVWAEGDLMRLFVNGNLLIEVVDTQLSRGMFGVFIGAAQTEDLTAFVKEIGYWNLPPQ